MILGLTFQKVAIRLYLAAPKGAAIKGWAFQYNRTARAYVMDPIEPNRTGICRDVKAKNVDSLLRLTILGQDIRFSMPELCRMHLLHFTIIAAFAATISACSSMYIVRCKDGYN